MSERGSIFSHVKFVNIHELYAVNEPFNVCCVVSAPLQPSSTDNIGLYRIGWLSSRDHIKLVDLSSLIADDDCHQTTVHASFNGLSRLFLFAYFVN